MANHSFRHRLLQGIWRVWQQPHWQAFAGSDWLDRIMDIAVTSNFHAKQGRSTGRLVLQANGRQLVVFLKRHYRLPWWQGLLALLRPDKPHSPALQELAHLQMARAAGLPVPDPIAGGEFIGPRGRLQSFLAIAELTGMLALHQAIPAAASQRDPAVFRRWKRGLIRELAHLIHEFHRRNWFHKDLYLCHFFIPEEDTRRVPNWTGGIHLIDLHRLGLHPWTGWWRRAKDLAQLLYSSELPGVTGRDRLRFWREYLNLQGLSGAPRHLLEWSILLKALIYRRNSRRKKK